MTFDQYSRVVLLSSKYEGEKAYVGSMGYIIEVYDDGHYEIEFSNPENGFTVAQIVVSEDEITLAEPSLPRLFH